MSELTASIAQSTIGDNAHKAEGWNRSLRPRRCAAPGGKAAHLLEISPAARLVAVDKEPGRLVNVSSALERLGLQARVMTGNAAAPSTFWDGHLFDRVARRGPLLGDRVIHRHPDIKVLRRPSDIARMAEEQSRMLAGLWPLLAPRG